MHPKIPLLFALVSSCTAGGSTQPEAKTNEQVEARGDEEPTSEPPAAPPAAEPVEAPGALEIAWGNKLREPSSFKPQPPGMTDEPDPKGWSAATGEFLFCVDDGGAVCTRCHFNRPGAEPEIMEYGEECATRSSHREVNERIEAGDFSIEDGAWAFGAEVVLVVSERRGKPDADGIARGVVRIGARLRAEGSEVAWLERVVDCMDNGGYCAPDVHVDTIAPSTDGRTIAVLAHTFAGEYSDTHPLALLDAEAVAAAAYNAQGLARLKAADFDRAAELFERVGAIDPDSWKGPYNLACARSRAGERALARKALEEAVRRGGDEVRRKAGEDADLDTLRGSPWFGEL